MNTETKKDQFEQFIEMVIEKAKARPLSANVSLVMIGLMALGGLNISIAMYDASYMDEVPGFVGFGSVALAIAMSALFGYGAALAGLWKMKRYGVYSVIGLAAHSVVSSVILKMALISSVLIFGAMAYFLWQDREKFS